MLTEFPGLLLWCVPGVIVWLLSFAPILRAAHNGGRPSPRGLRLNLVGMGLIFLGGAFGLVLAARPLVLARGAAASHRRVLTRRRCTRPSR